MYTIPHSTLISSLSLNHHLYADDTQLFFNFHPRNFDSSIIHFQTALKHISWMSANLLTINSSKTEFLIIGLKRQLSEINNCSLNTLHATLILLLMNILPVIRPQTKILTTPLDWTLICQRLRFDLRLFALMYKYLIDTDIDSFVGVSCCSFCYALTSDCVLPLRQIWYGYDQ